MNTTIFICQLPTEKQNRIQSQVKNYLENNEYSVSESQNIIDNIMDDRLCHIEEFINIQEYLL